MANSYVASRAHLVFALCLPLAVLLGYMLAFSALDRGSMLFVLMLIGVLSVPVLMNWYHPVLLLTWNAAITPYFLPGQPFIWMLVAFIGVGFAIMNRLTTPEARFVPVTSINRVLLVLLGVVIVTAYLRGGIGLRAFGSAQYGGKGYFYVVGAIAGYFALISKQLPKERAGTFVALFFLSALTSLVPNLAYLGGPNFSFLFYLFPPVYAYEQAAGDYLAYGSEFVRVYGLTFGSNGLYCFLLARYGLRGIFDLRKPLRLVMFVAAVAGCLFCGFRSFMLLFLLTVFVQFFTEKLFRPRVFLVMASVGALVGGLILTNMDNLPNVVQRSLSFIPSSFLPVDIKPSIRSSAEGTSEWRLQLWGEVLPEVPRYLLLGKGYNLDPGELFLATERDRRGWSHYAWALVSGAYHNGALTLIVPFGIWGLLAFLWFLVVSLKYLLRTYRYGDPTLKTINTFLLTYFVAKTLYYFAIFGSFFNDLYVFTGLIGLSVSLNGLGNQDAQEQPSELDMPQFDTNANR